MLPLSLRLRNIPIMGSMLLVAATPILTILALATWLVLPQINNANQQKQFASLIELSTEMSALVHEQQKERGLSAVFLASSGKKFGDKLQTQRKLVDRQSGVVEAQIETQIAHLLKQGTTGSRAEYANALRDILASLNQVDGLRNKVSKLTISKGEAVAFYTDLNARILGAIGDISNLSTDSQATASLNSFAGFLQGKDRAGIERALGSSAVSTGDFSNPTILRINGLIEQQDVFMSVFLADATEAQKEEFARVMSTPAVQTVLEMREVVLAGTASGKSPEFTGSDFFDAQTARINLLKNTEEMIVRDILQSAEQRGARAQTQAVIATAISLVLMLGSIAVTVLLSQLVRRSMVQVSEAARAMSTGDLEIDLPEAGKTELGQISSALDEFRKSIVAARVREEETREKERLAEMAEHTEMLRSQKETEAQLKEEHREAEVVRQREKAVADEISEVVAACAGGDFSMRLNLEGKEGVFLELCRGVNQIGEVTDRGLADISRAMSALSDGKLTFRIDQEYQGVFGEIAEAVNGSMKSLGRTINEIRETGIIVSDSTKSLSSAAEDLSLRTEKNAAILEETNAGLGELATSVTGAAEGAEQVRTDATDMVEQTENGTEVIDATITAMQEIKESSNSITSIVDLIESIAFQTNLLALNAGVEAARAGNAGRGFAVVATEVRELAARSSTAAKEISELIAISSQRVDDGVDLVDKSGKVLRSIAAGIAKTSEHIAVVADAAGEQALNIKSITESTDDLDRSTQQNAAMFEETTAAIQTMESEFETLMAAVGAFDIGADNTNDTSAAHRRPKGKAA